MTDASPIAGHFRFQATACRSLGSDMWSAMCDLLADDIESNGVTRELLDGHLEARFGLALPLRLLGAVHYVALDGRAPHLAAQLPSCGGEPIDGFDAVFDAIRDVMVRHPTEIVDALDRPVQTNEVGRAAALIVAMSWVAASTGVPLHLTEIGCSAGLLLTLDRFSYEGSFGAIGPVDSPVALRDRWLVDHPVAEVSLRRDPTHRRALPITVASRAGVDPFPIDPTTDDGARRLHSFVWPDQHRRRSLLRGAIEVAHSTDVRRSAASTPGWLSERLTGSAAPGTARVVMHSIVWQYVDKAERRLIDDVFDEFGSAATPDTPLARVRFEPDLTNRSQVRVDATLWRGGPPTTTHVADSCYHGSWVRPAVPTWPPTRPTA